MAEFTKNEKGKTVVIYDNGAKRYLPTRKEHQLIELLLNPDHYSMTVKERCEQMDVSTNWYWTMINKKEVQEVLHECYVAAMVDKQGVLLQATFDYAVNDPKCGSDRKLLAGIFGLIKDKKEININQRNMNLNIDIATTPTEELTDMVKKMIKEDPSMIPQKVLMQLVEGNNEDDNEDVLETEEYEIEDEFTE